MSWKNARKESNKKIGCGLKNIEKTKQNENWAKKVVLKNKQWNEIKHMFEVVEWKKVVLLIFVFLYLSLFAFKI